MFAWLDLRGALTLYELDDPFGKTPLSVYRKDCLLGLSTACWATISGHAVFKQGWEPDRRDFMQT
jgi:hypothetical protein